MKMNIKHTVCAYFTEAINTLFLTPHHLKTSFIVYSQKIHLTSVTLIPVFDISHL